MTERFKTIDVLYSVILALFCFITTYALFGFYYETNDEVQMELFFRSITAPPGTWDLYYWHRISGPVLMMLYRLFPEISWYGLFLYFILFLSAVHFFILLSKIFINRRYVWLGACIIFFFFILFESVITINFLRVTLLLSVSVLALFLVIYPEIKERKHRIVFILYFFIVFFLAYQIRPDGGKLVIGLSFLITIPLYLLNRLKWKHLLPLYGVILTGAALVFLYDQWHYTGERKEDEKTIPYFMILHNFTGAGRTESLEDSIKMKIAIDGFFWDQKLITDSYLKNKLSNYNLQEALLKDIREYLNLSYHLVYIFVKNNLPLAFLYTITLIGILYNGIKTRNTRLVIYYFLIHFLFFTAMVVLAMWKKMPNRLLTSLWMYIFTAHLIYLIYYPINHIGNKKLFFYAGVVLLVISMALYAYRYDKRIEWLKERCRSNSWHIAEIENMEGYQYVIYSRDAVSLFNGLNPMKVTPLYKRHHYIIWGWTNWYGSFKRYMTEITGSDTFEGMMEKVLNLPHILVSTEYNAEIIVQHLRLRMQRIYHYEKIHSAEILERSYIDKIIRFYRLTATN